MLNGHSYQVGNWAFESLHLSGSNISTLILVLGSQNLHSFLLLYDEIVQVLSSLS